MIPIYLYLVGSTLIGLGFWLGRTSGRSAERNSRERDNSEVARIRGGLVALEAPLPAQQGTLAEHGRRLAIASTPHVPEPVESWPLLWRVLWPVLLFVARFWWTPAGVGVDRAVVASCAFLGRHERHWWRDYGTHRLEDAGKQSVWEILAALDWKVEEPQMVEVS